MPSYTIPAGSIAEIQFVGTHNAQRVRTILHYRLTGTSSIADGKAALDDINSSLAGPGKLWPSLAAVVDEDVLYGFAQIQWINPQRYAFEQYAPPTPMLQPSSPALPSNSAICINKRNFLTGRHSHGDVHLPGVPRAWISGNQIQVSSIGTYANLLSALKTNITLVSGPVLEPILYNRTASAASLRVDETQLYTDVRTMRRRTSFRGE